MRSLYTNQNLRELDLSSNKLGQAETLNAVKPDIVTGGESLSVYLASNKCKIESLKLSWNAIRMASAATFANSIALNHSLLYLDLSYNGLGNKAGEILGQSLQSQVCNLRHLKLTNNAIGGSASLVIAMALIENRLLSYVDLDENPIGVFGSHALMQIPKFSGSRVSVSISKCNTQLNGQSHECWFDPMYPCKNNVTSSAEPDGPNYILKLENYYDRNIGVNIFSKTC